MLEKVDERTYAARLAKCGACPMLIRATKQCNPMMRHPATGNRGCGCFVKLKAKLRNEHCPGGQW